jgi:hypothetical protein
MGGVGYYLFHRWSVERLQAEISSRTRQQIELQGVTDRTRAELLSLFLANGDAANAQNDPTAALLWYAHALNEDYHDRTRNEAHRQRIREVLTRCPRVLGVFAHNGYPGSVALSSDGRRVVTADGDRIARIWDIESGESRLPPLLHDSPILTAAFNADRRRLVTGCSNGTARIWNLLTAEPVGAPMKHSTPVRNALFNSNNRVLLTVADDDTVARVWDANSGRSKTELHHDAPVRLVSFSPDGQKIASACADGTIRLWNLSSGTSEKWLGKTGRPVTRVAFDSTGRRLLACTHDELRVWTVGLEEPAPFVIRHDGSIRAVSFSPDERRLLSAGEDHIARVSEATTGRPLLALRHSGIVTHAVFSPDGRWIVTSSAGRLHFWDAATGQPGRLPVRHQAEMVHLQFSAEGDLLFSATADGIVRTIGWDKYTTLHELPPGPLLSFAQLLAERQIDGTGHLQPLSPGSLRQEMEKLRGRYGSQFGLPDREAWHRTQAEFCEKENHWFGAQFHWGRVLAFFPRDAAVRERRDHAAREFEKVEAEQPRTSEVIAALPPRSAQTRAALLDLSAHYNAVLTETWLPGPLIVKGNDLSGLPRGVQKLAGVEFDVRGVIQLSSGALENLGGRFPRRVNGIPVRQGCQRLHFLHGTAWNALFGTQVGHYVVHYRNGKKREIKLVFGRNVRDWWFPASQPQMTPAATVAWEGSNAASRELGMAIRLYRFAWDNPEPATEEITAIDFVSAMEKPAPFLVAITVE